MCCFLNNSFDFTDFVLTKCIVIHYVHPVLVSCAPSWSICLLVIQCGLYNRPNSAILHSEGLLSGLTSHKQIMTEEIYIVKFSSLKSTFKQNPEITKMRKIPWFAHTGYDPDCL